MGHWHRPSSRNAAEDTGAIKGPSAPRVSHPLTASPGEPHPTTAFHTDLLNLQAFLVKDEGKNKIVLRNGDGFCQHEVSKTNHERQRGGGEHGSHRGEPSRARGCTPGSSARDAGRWQQTGAPLAGARSERTAEPPPPGTRSTGRHRPRPRALPCPVPRPPGRQRRRSVSPGERGGDRAGSSADPIRPPWPAGCPPASPRWAACRCRAWRRPSGCAPLQLRGLSGATRPSSPATTRPPPPRSAPDVPPSPLGLSIGSSTRPAPLVIGERVCLFVCMSARRVGGCVAGAARAGVRCPPRRVPSGTRVPPHPWPGSGEEAPSGRSRRLPPLGRAPRHRAGGEWGSETDRDVSTLRCSAQVMVVKRSFWKKSKQTSFFFFFW